MGFSQSSVSMCLAKCSPSCGIPGPLLGRRWLEHHFPGGLRERLIKYEGGLCSRLDGQPKTEQERGARKCICSLQS